MCIYITFLSKQKTTTSNSAKTQILQADTGKSATLVHPSIFHLTLTRIFKVFQFSPLKYCQWSCRSLCSDIMLGGAHFLPTPFNACTGAVTAQQEAHDLQVDSCCANIQRQILGGNFFTHLLFRLVRRPIQGFFFPTCPSTSGSHFSIWEISTKWVHAVLEQPGTWFGHTDQSCSQRAGCLAHPRHIGLIAHPLHSYSTQAPWPFLQDLGHLRDSCEFRVDAYLFFFWQHNISVWKKVYLSM